MQAIVQCIESEIAEYCRSVAGRFHLPVEDVISHANGFWKIKITAPKSGSSLHPKVKQAISEINPPLLQCTGDTTSASTVGEIMGTSTKKKKEEKPNKCTYKYKSGKEAGNACNVPCSGERCNRHSNTQSQKAKSTATDQPSIDTALAPSVPMSAAARKLKKQVSEISDKFGKVIIDTLIKDREPLKLTKNNWGRYIHLQTRLVYDPQTETIIGKQMDDEKDVLTDLNANDIEQCRLWHVKYKLPTTIASPPDSAEQAKPGQKKKVEIEFVSREESMYVNDSDEDEVDGGDDDNAVAYEPIE